MSLSEQIQKDITAAMKARDEARLSTLRMVKTALKNREIEKMAPLDDKEAQQVLSTLIKQRRDSIAGPSRAEITASGTSSPRTRCGLVATRRPCCCDPVIRCCMPSSNGC